VSVDLRQNTLHSGRVAAAVDPVAKILLGQTTSPSRSTVVDDGCAEAVAILGLELDSESSGSLRAGNCTAPARALPHTIGAAAPSICVNTRSDGLLVRALIHAIPQVLLRPDDVAFRVHEGRR